MTEKLTKQDLKERQAWTLNQKIDHSIGVIDQFISHQGGKDKIYISFSGGKDSTVLLHLARKVFGDDIKAVFCNTRNEYPDIVKFVRKTPNVEIIYPKMTPKEVITKYGFPLVSKEQSQIIRQIRTTKSDKLRNKRLYGDVKGKSGIISKCWLFLTKVIFDTSEKCCDRLKKSPFKTLRKRGLSPITGEMAEESDLRVQQWMRHGCNMFGENSKSTPLSIWTEKDIYDYIERYKVEISEIYHKGAKRTGCMFCGFGCQFWDDNRLSLMYELYPKYYLMVMNTYTNNDVTYREALRKVLAVNKLYLPDERPRDLFSK